MSDIKISSNLRQNSRYKIKSYTFVTIFILLIIGLLLLIGNFGPDLFALLIFFAIMSIPMLLLFRNKLIGLLPSAIADSLIEIDHQEEAKRKLTFNMTRYMRELGLYIMAAIFLIGSCIFIYKANKEITNKKNIIKIIGGLICASIAGVIILEIEIDYNT